MNPSRRAFTLLELLLASALGGVLVLACLGLFAVLDRTDQALARRHQQAAEMATLHLAMERTFANMLMARDSDVQQESQNRSSIIQGEPMRPSRPRLLLTQDSALGATGSATPQRLEVVLSRAPLPPGYGRDEVPTEDDMTFGNGPVRGVFELRREEDGWSIWWRPLPRDEHEEGGYLFTTDPRDDPRAVRIAGGLRQAQWLAFKDRERAPEFEAKLAHDLPAYMEFNVEMTSGYAAQWMFEVAWLNGPETVEEMAAEEEEALAAGPLGALGPGRRQTSGRPQRGSAGDDGSVRDVGGGSGTTRRNVARPVDPRSDTGGKR